MRPCIKFTLALLFVLLPGFASAEDKFFDSNGVQIRYVEQGSGDPVVLVHGYAGGLQSGWINNGVFENLAKDHHVIALDNRGHGKSGKPHEAKAYGNQMSEDVVRLMDHLKIPRAHFIGYSLGGMIVMKMLATHPDRFLTATVGGMGILHLAAADLEKDASAIEHGDFRSLIVATWPSDEPPPTDDIIRQRSQAIIAAGNDPVALAQVWRGFGDLVVSNAQVSAVRVPTLEVVGSFDPMLTAANELKTAMPALKITVVEGATHSGDRGTPKRPEFVNAVRAFIEAAGKSAAK
jgi:pimeloyl-ACP methyl ester carboxylesterase